ncbi:hypothetical protein [Streptomyces sp. I8-5]
MELTPKDIYVHEYLRDSEGKVRLDHLGPVVWTRRIAITEDTSDDAG